jgi:hypothetical protein
MFRGLKKRLEKVLLSSLVIGSSLVGGCGDVSGEGRNNFEQKVSLEQKEDFSSGSFKEVKRKKELDLIMEEALKNKSVEKENSLASDFSEEELKMIYGKQIFSQSYLVEVSTREGKTKPKQIEFRLFQNPHWLIAEYVSEDNGGSRIYKRETGQGWSSDLSHPGFFS